jgi:hypothetical protein
MKYRIEIDTNINRVHNHILSGFDLWLKDLNERSGILFKDGKAIIESNTTDIVEVNKMIRDINFKLRFLSITEIPDCDFIYTEEGFFIPFGHLDDSSNRFKLLDKWRVL